MSRAPDTDQLFFEATKEHRGWYFVEYRPPNPGRRFATLFIVVLDSGKLPEDIAKAMETELTGWLERYPVPIMVSAFDDTGSLIDLRNERSCSNAIGFLDADTNKLICEWRVMSDAELPKDALDITYLRKVYADMPFRTKQQLRERAHDRAKHLRFGWWIVFVWAVVVPAAAAILEWWSDWLGVVVLVYSLYKALEKALRLTGGCPGNC